MNPYEILEVSITCTDEEITVAYRAKAKKCHPDLPGGNAEEFALLAIAVAVLRDPHKRKLFDEFGIILESSEGHINNKVKAVFIEVSNAWIDRQLQSGRELNLKEFFDMGFVGASAKINKSIEDSKGQIRLLEKMKGRVRTEEKESRITALLESRIEGLKSIMKNAEEEKYIMGLVKEICDKYDSYEAPESFTIEERLFMGRSRTNTTFTFFTPGA